MTWCRIITTWNRISCSSIGKFHQIWGPHPASAKPFHRSLPAFTEKFRPRVPWSKEWCRLRVVHHDASLEYLPPSPVRGGQSPFKKKQKLVAFFGMFSYTLNVQLFTTLYRLKLFAFRKNDTWFDGDPLFLFTVLIPSQKNQSSNA